MEKANHSLNLEDQKDSETTIWETMDKALQEAGIEVVPGVLDEREAETAEHSDATIKDQQTSKS